MEKLRVLFALCGLLVCVPAAAETRELYWETLAVKAHLTAEGRLEVEERQTMVFTGDWNGGERTFNIRPRQELSFAGMSRVDPKSGAEHPMSEGSLDEVDHYGWHGKDVLRWRSRLPSDPPFDKTPITYVLRYSLDRILLRDGDQYVLDHDFAFANRVLNIDHFTLDLTLDPAWEPLAPLQKRWSVDSIPPGKSFVLRVPLRFTGAGAPAANEGISGEMRTMLAAMGIVPLLLLAWALLREKVAGRLDRVREEDVTREWLEKNLLRERAEVIGAMWDDNVGASEVSATLARMVSEKRLRSRVSGKEMELDLLSRENLDGYEKELIGGLFFDGDRTSTSAIRLHYASTGFNPASIIAPGLKQLVETRLPKGKPVKPSSIPMLVLFAAAVTLMVLGVRRGDAGMPSFVIVLATLFSAGIAMIAPGYWRPRKSLGVVSALFAMLPAAILTSIVALIVWMAASMGQPDLSRERQLALGLLGIWIFGVSANTLRSRESREAIAYLKMLGTARNFFRRELRKERPMLDDAWYPYILAFGLNRHVERWFESFGGVGRDRGRHTTTSSGSFSDSSGRVSNWTGGGGSFGGAGATGMWAAAATGMAAGVAAPSSSSGGGSSSSSGGSSGGGGGGGW